MKLKREHVVILRNAIPNFKGWLLFLLLFTVFCAEAQVYSVSSAAGAGGNPGTTEVNATDPPATPGRFVITPSGPSFFNVTVNYTVTGTATPGVGKDYETLSGSVVFASPSVSPISIDVNVLDDNIVENTESVVVTLTSSTVGSVNATPAEVLISDVSDVGTFSLDVNQPPFIPNASENGPIDGRFSIILDKANGTGAPVTVNYTLSGTAATDGSDYSLSGAVIMAFNNDESQVVNDLNIVPIPDNVFENLETVVLTLDSTDNPLKFSIGAPNTAEVTIENKCNAGNVAPIINDIETNFCGDFTVTLDSYSTGARPPLTGLVWTTNENDPLNQAFWTVRDNDSPVNVPGVYFAFFWDEDNGCTSPLARLELTRSEQPSAGTLVNPSPTPACNNNTPQDIPGQINLSSLITGQAAGTWVQTSGTTVGAIPANTTVDFVGRAVGDYVFTYTTNTAVAPCINQSIAVTIAVADCNPCLAGNAAPILNANVPTTFCGPITTSLNDYAPNAGPNETVLRWALSDEDPIGNPVPNAQIISPTPGVYYGFYFDAANTCNSPLLTLTLNQNDTPEITGSTGNSRCGPGTVQLSATGSLDATLRWYTTAAGGTPIRDGASFTTPNILATTSYFVEATANGCISPRTEVVATVIPQPSAGAPRNASSCNAADFGVTILDLDSTFSGTPGTGAWSLTSGPSAVSLDTENVVDFQGSANGVYVFTYTTNGAQAPCENATAQVTISVSSCDSDDDGDGLLGGLEATLGTDPNNPDTDGDTINDGVEVGNNPENPLDGDADGIIDALDSNILDTDLDGVNDQQDPANENACIPDNTNGLCDTDQDGIPDGVEEANGTNPLDACDPDIENGNCNPTPIDLEVLKVVDIPNAIAGDQVVFTVTVNNLSERTGVGITIGDMLETGFEPNGAATASVGSYDAAAGVWTIPQLPAMGSATLLVPVTVLDGGPYNNVAELLESFPLDDNPANDRAEVILEIALPEGIDLVLEKFGRIVDQTDTLSVSDVNRSLSEVNPLIGQEVVFTIKLTNGSREDTVSNIQVLDTIAAVAESGFEVLEASADRGVYNQTTGIWSIPELARNEVAILEIRVVVPNAGTFQNTAEILRSSPADSEGKYDNNTSTVTVNVSERTKAEFGIIFNQFSPNNDGVNDDLKINKRRNNDDGTLGEEVDIQYSIKIFNRYGSLVFEDDQLTDEVIWDGTRKGKDVPDGTYFYVLNLNVLEEIEGIDTNSVKKGWIQVIR